MSSLHRPRLSSKPVTGLSAIVALAALLGVLWPASRAAAATIQKRYYAHEAVHDKYGVIAPWYKGQNGQLDFRLRIAAETLKRYPWVEPPAAPSAAPHYVFNGHWKVRVHSGRDGAGLNGVMQRGTRWVDGSCRRSEWANAGIEGSHKAAALLGPLSLCFPEQASEG